MTAARMATVRTPTPPWPSSHEFVEAMQNPRLAFRNPELQRCLPAQDRFGLPLVASGNFAYAFKLRDPATQRAVAVRCFRAMIPDRDQRYELMDRHLRSHREASLASFVFDHEGILVGGRRYPIVVMEWIEGPTLDLYIEQALSSKAMLQALADQWLRTVRGLREAQLAHGDLQHGNIIVRDGCFRLIDLDAMYVPGMLGWRSNELGHVHFQHPRRDLNCFDLGLDKFSALVIYLSIIALAEAPSLWQRYHDENLIFTRQDYIAPAASPLLAEVRRLGDTHRSLVEALEQALRGRPGDTPDLLELVKARSGLPAWMTQPITDVKIEVRTREAPPGTAPVAVTAAVIATPASPWPASHPAGQPRAPSTGRNPPRWRPRPAQAPPAPLPLEFDWARVHVDALANFGAWILTTGVLSLFPLLVVASNLVPHSWFGRHLLPLCFSLLALACLAAGYGVAILAENSRVSRLRTLVSGYAGATSVSAPPRRRRGRMQARTPLLIGDRLTSSYHLPVCPMVASLPARHRVDFSSEHSARAHGLHPCARCLP